MLVDAAIHIKFAKHLVYLMPYLLAGVLCLCWQELTSPTYKPGWLYTVAVFDKELWIRYPSNVSSIQTEC